MLGLKVRKENAERVKKYLAGHKLMVINYRIISSNEFIYFPIASRKGIDGSLLKETKADIVDTNFEKIEGVSSYKEMLKKKLGKSYSESPRGYDIIGDIAVIDSAESKIAAKKTAQVIMSISKNVKTVLSKGGPVSGVYRTRKFSYIAGKKNYETVYRENGASFSFDVRDTFFSTRLAFERGRIVKECRDKENVLVMFAGIGPFAIEIGRVHRKSKVLAMELNRKAYLAMLDNIRINKAVNVTAECGDVKKLVLKHRNFADRIIMPHPTDSYSFLDAVVAAAGKRCIVHYYAFGKRDGAFDYHTKRLRGYFKGHKIKFRVLFKRVVRDYSPSDIEVVIDFLITKG